MHTHTRSMDKTSINDRQYDPSCTHAKWPKPRCTADVHTVWCICTTIFLSIIEYVEGCHTQTAGPAASTEVSLTCEELQKVVLLETTTRNWGGVRAKHEIYLWATYKWPAIYICTKIMSFDMRSLTDASAIAAYVHKRWPSLRAYMHVSHVGTPLLTGTERGRPNDHQNAEPQNLNGSIEWRLVRRLSRWSKWAKHFSYIYAFHQRSNWVPNLRTVQLPQLKKQLIQLRAPMCKSHGPTRLPGTTKADQWVRALKGSSGDGAGSSPCPHVCTSKSRSRSSSDFWGQYQTIKEQFRTILQIIYTSWFSFWISDHIWTIYIYIYVQLIYIYIYILLSTESAVLIAVFLKQTI